MPPDLSPEWTQVRYEYEHTDKPVDEIGLDHGVSPSTLRDRVRRWRWTRRRQPVSAEGPPPMPPVELAALVPAVAPIGAAAPQGEHAADAPAPHAAPGEMAPPDPAGIAPRLQGAVARVLPAIEATLAKLAAGPMPPREMERAARALSSLTRTLRELNTLLNQYPAPPPDDRGPDDPDEFALDLVQKINAFAARQEAARAAAGNQTADSGAQPEA